MGIFNFEQDIEVENRSIISITYRVHRHTKKTHIIVKSIHPSLRSESKIPVYSKYLGKTNKIKESGNIQAYFFSLQFSKQSILCFLCT